MRAAESDSRPSFGHHNQKGEGVFELHLRHRFLLRPACTLDRSSSLSPLPIAACNAVGVAKRDFLKRMQASPASVNPAAILR